MRPRITDKQLQYLVDEINRATGNPRDPWTAREYPETGYKANIGNYHLSGAYGGVSLHQICSDGGGVHDTFRCGHIPKRELYERMRAFLDGLNAKSA